MAEPEEQNPVITEPQPEANLKSTQVGIKPAIPPVEIEQVDLTEPVEKSIKPEGELTIDAVLERIGRGEDVTLIGRGGREEKVRSSTSKALRQQIVDGYSAEGQLNRLLKEQLAVHNVEKDKRFQGMQGDKPVIGFVTVEGKISADHLDADIQEPARIYAEGRQQLYESLRPIINTGRPDIDKYVNQYFIDEFITGDSARVLAGRLTDIGRGALSLPGAGLNLLGNPMSLFGMDGGGAGLADTARRAVKLGIPLTQAWKELQPKRQEIMGRITSDIEKAIPFGLGSVEALNRKLLARAKQDYDNNVFSDDPDVNKAIYEDLIYDIDVRGEQISRTLITPEVAYEAQKEAMNQVNGNLQAAILLAENMIAGGFLSKTRNRQAIDEYNRFIRIAKSKGIDTTRGTDYIKSKIMLDRTSTKLDDKLINLGRFNVKRQEQRDVADANIIKLKNELNLLASQGKRNSLDYKRKQSDLMNLRNSLVRDNLKNKISPYFQEILVGELTVAAAGAFSRNQFGGAYGFDEETWEIFGMFGGLFIEGTGIRKGSFRIGKKVIGVPLGGTASAVARLTESKFEGFYDGMSALTTKLTFGDTTVADYEKLYFVPQNGRRMNFDERRRLALAFKQIDKMDASSRQEVLGRLQEVNREQENLLSMFNEGTEQEQARKLLGESLAETIGVPQAMAAYQTAVRNADIKIAQKGGIGAMWKSHQEATEKAARADVLLRKFEEHAIKFGDARTRETAKKLINATRSSIDQAKLILENEYEELSGALKLMGSRVVEDPSVPLSDEFLDDYLDAYEYLQGRIGVNDPAVKNLRGAKEKTALKKEAFLELHKSLIRRFDGIRGERKDEVLQSDNLRSALEATVFLRDKYFKEEMDVAYDSFRDFVKETSLKNQRPDIDLTDSVKFMLELAGESDKEITAFFGPNSTFFSGSMGRDARRMFTRMVDRSFNAIPQDELAEFYAQMQKRGISAEELNDMYNDDPLNFGLMLHQGGINMFARANIEEAEEFRRAFRDYGYKTSNNAVKGKYKEFENIINTQMKNSDPDGYEMLDEARTRYTQLNDPLREGSPLQKILKGYAGQKTSKDGDVLSNLYANDASTPYRVFSSIGDTVSDIMLGKQAPLDARNTLDRQLSQMAQLFGTPTVDGRIRIDLRDPEGMANFALLSAAVEAVVYDKWAHNFLKIDPEETAKIGDPRLLGFKQDARKNLEGLDQLFKIDVIGDDGIFRPEIIFSPSDLIRREKDIGNLIQKGGELFDEGVQVAKELKVAINNASTKLNVTIKQEERSFEALNNILSIATKDDIETKFYDRYISGFEDIDDLKDSFIRVFRKDPKNDSVSDDDVAALFDNAVVSMTMQSLYKKGKYNVQQKKVVTELEEFGKEKQIKGFLGENIQSSGFGDIFGVREELYDEDTFNNLSKVIDVKHLEKFRGIIDYLAEREINTIAGTAMLTAGKAITANEALSRAYNIARGMVSPTYVATETTLRLMRKMNQDALLLALQSEEAAGIIVRLLKNPELVTRPELDAFDDIVKSFVATDLVRKGQQQVAVSYLDSYIEQDTVVTEEEKQQIQQTIQQRLAKKKGQN